MTIPAEGHGQRELRSALASARENENRWLELAPEASADSARIEQWASIASLRRREVERIEALLREASQHG